MDRLDAIRPPPEECVMRDRQDTHVVYEIPLQALPDYRGRRVIVRSTSPADVVLACRLVPDADVVCVQLDGLPNDVEALAGWGYGIPIQLTMPDPAVELPALYRYAGLVDQHPIRVAMPVRRGFSGAVRLATSLGMAVKLDVGQPSAAALEELTTVLDVYLHGSGLSQPIEFFHGVMRALYHRQPITLREIHDDDPARARYVDAAGIEWPGRHRALVPETAECRTCEFWTLCAGYFKWPQRDYECAGIKSLLRKLVAAAADLRPDVEKRSTGVAERAS